MAVSSTTFAQRIDTIKSGQTTSWTVPGQGMATAQDERSFLSKAHKKVGRKLIKTPVQARGNPLKPALAFAVGATSVIVARWINFTYLDTAIAFAAEKGVDVASIIANVPTVLFLALVLNIIVMCLLGLRIKYTAPFQVAGGMGAFVFEGDLVAMAPEFYARFYPQSWIAEMVANAALLS